MADRELLELAAKAAGIAIRPMVVKPPPWDDGDGFIGYITKVEQWPRGWFNPLADDGDALRLAVDLGFDVCVNSAATIVYGEYDFEGGMVEDHGSDARAATRRAIVRAAAEQAKDAEARG